MTTANIVAWIVIGGLVGVIVAALARREETTRGRLVVDLVVGLLGGVVAGILLNAIGGLVGSDIAGVNLAGGAAAILGALILVGVVEWMRSTQP